MLEGDLFTSLRVCAERRSILVRFLPEQRSCCAPFPCPAHKHEHMATCGNKHNVYTCYQLANSGHAPSSQAPAPGPLSQQIHTNLANTVHLIPAFLPTQLASVPVSCRSPPPSMGVPGTSCPAPCFSVVLCYCISSKCLV